MSETMRKRPELDLAEMERAKARQLPTATGRLARELVQYVTASEFAFDPVEYGRTLTSALSACWNKEPEDMESLWDFYTTQVRQAMELLVGAEEAEQTGRILNLRLKMILSSTPFRKSYHSASVRDMVPQLSGILASCAAWHFYGMTTAQAAEYDTEFMRGFMWHLALELSENDEAAMATVREAIFGDNSRVLFSVQIIRAIVISGNPDALDMLGKLLLAAKRQEGIRQQILENMDWGSKETTLYFLRLVQDNGLTRFSSVIRAMDTWTGLGYGSAKPALAEKCVKLAVDVLSDPAAIQRYIESSDNLEIYFALWGTAVGSLDGALPLVERLLADERPYRRLTAMYFIACSDCSDFGTKVALEHLDERDEEALAWVLRLLDDDGSRWASYECQKQGVYKDDRFPKKREERQRIFDALEEVVEFVGNKKRTFNGSVFPWMQVELTAMPALSAMLALTALGRSEAMLDRLLNHWRDLSSDMRQYVQERLLQPEKNPEHRRLLLRESLSDRSSSVRYEALKKLSSMYLEESDMAYLCDALSSRSSEYRKQLVALLAKQGKGMLAFALDRLLVDKDERRMQGGLSLLMAIQKEQADVAESYLQHLRVMDTSDLSGQTQVLIEQLVGKHEDWTAENGFGLFDPNDIGFQPEHYALECAPAKVSLLDRLLGKKADDEFLSDKELHRLLYVPDTVVLDFVGRMKQVFTDHADYEYEAERWDGGREKALFGNLNLLAYPPVGSRRPNPVLEDYPFWQEFLEAAGPIAKDPMSLTCIMLRLGDQEYEHTAAWFRQWRNSICPVGSLHEKVWKEYGHVCFLIQQMLGLMRNHVKTPDWFQRCFRVYVSLGNSLGEKNWGTTFRDASGRFAWNNDGTTALTCQLLENWREQVNGAISMDEDFAAYFCRLRYETLRVNEKMTPLRFEEYMRAYHLGLTTEAVLYQQLTSSPAGHSNLQAATETRGKTEALVKQYPQLEQLVSRAVDRIITMEERRGELPTPLTHSAGSIKRFEGVGHFIALLTALGKDDFYRGYEFSSPEEKKESLSKLLKHCHPAAEDTAEDLAELAKQAGIRDERLAQAAMYAPQWAKLVEEATHWTGLKSGVWLFHAHISEYFSAEKETEVAIYSPITPRQFNDGVFDKNWFLSVYEALGEKRFRVLYRCAKYITTGTSQHRRSQLFTDAVLGRLDADELLAEIKQSRNQEKLRAWPLIPLRDEQDALARYEYLRLFEKESRKFGAQRRDSEKKACRTALENLATAMDCPDVDRMIWRLEGQKLESILPLTQPQMVDGVELKLAFAEDGTPSIGVIKNGKALKSVPASLKKHETVLELRETVKGLTEQRRRARQSLENAMVTSSPFRKKEVSDLLGNPVLGPLVAKLLWCSNGVIGLPVLTDGVLYLTDYAGTATPAGDELRVAHPHDMMEAGCWSEWQRAVFAQRLVQPFKQVFREYYPLTDEERFEGTCSRRYAGNQVQPKKAAALLRGRGWTVDYEQGLQKVCYEENLVVHIYAMADWFSPAEVEPPTLEIVQFYDRATGQLRKLDTVPPITFSEAMRDLDLMVSVAHAGGVDPETSHSTVEMRVAIATELLQLLRIKNVEMLGSHAKIHGGLGNYSVHMGSAVTHMEGKGSLVILPVHSQTRGRIFLPFADEDPKTAEVMSKILLLAEDGKIKDPAILAQIGSR